MGVEISARKLNVFRAVRHIPSLLHCHLR